MRFSLVALACLCAGCGAASPPVTEATTEAPVTGDRVTEEVVTEGAVTSDEGSAVATSGSETESATGLPTGEARTSSRLLTSLADVHDACEARSGEPALWAIDVDAPLALALRDDAIAVDASQPLMALGGQVKLVSPVAEDVALTARGTYRDDLVRALAAGGHLRVGFFLGFDDPGRTRCLVRPPQATTVVRAELAFAEVRDVGGRVLARDDYDRLRAWADDAARDEAPIALEPSFTTPRARDLVTPVLADLVACRHDQEPGFVRVRVRAAGGSRSASIEVASALDDDARRCITARIEALPFETGEHAVGIHFAGAPTP